jgi:uncharacterized protein (TIGR00369 family)
MTTSDDPARTRTITWADPAISAAEAGKRSGLDFMRALIAGEIPPPPIGILMNMRIVEVDAGRAVFECDPAEYHYNPIGSVHGGFAATIFDSALGCAVQTALPEGSAYATTDLQVRLLRRITAETGTMRCEGIVVHVGRTLATAEARLTDRAGKLYGTATTACSVFPFR